MITRSWYGQLRKPEQWARTLSVAALFVVCTSSLTAETAQLHVIAEPAGATLSINGTERGTCPLTLLDLPTGKHLIKVEKRGYNPIRETLTLSAADRVTREYKLKPILGLLLVHSSPSGADIEINGAHRGTTPALISDLPLGQYRARIVKPGYIPREIEINIEGRKPQKFDVALSSDSATLILTSDPVGADVTLNGILRGMTPCTLNRIPSGSVTLELSLDGFEPYSESLKLAAGEQETITAVLKPIPSDLQLVSIPTGARIYVNNQFRGLAPVMLKGLSPGQYRIRAEMEAHDIMLRSIDVGRAKNVVEEFRLQRNAGGLDITTEPAGAVVLIDGKEVGATAAGTNSTDRISHRLSLDLIPCGTHVLTLTKEGFYDNKTEIEIVRNQTITRHVRLKRRFIPNYEVKTATEVYRGILIEVDTQRNVKLETHPGIFKTLMYNEIRSKRPLREDQLEEDL